MEVPALVLVALLLAPIILVGWRRMRRGAWQKALPTLIGERVTLREIEARDTAAILEWVTDARVCEFVLPPPDSSEAFAQFIQKSRAGRARGRFACFVVIPSTGEAPVGLFQLFRVGSSPSRDWMWGFVMRPDAWGTGIFTAAATTVLGFAFDEAGVTQLDGWCLTRNLRANAALKKLGAVHVADRRDAVDPGGLRGDFSIWRIDAATWRRRARNRRTQ